MNETELFVEFDNKSIFRVEGADRPDRLRGPDWAGLGIDEWALMKREIWEEILRPVIAQDKNRWAVFSFTPKGINHAHEYWENALKWKGWYRSMLKASESGILPQDQLDMARIEMTDALYNQEFECSFVAREDKSMITSEMLERLDETALFFEETVKLIACDPSEGGDACVIKVFENTQVIDQLVLHENNTMIISGHIQNLGFKHGIKNYVGDVIGCGKGIADDLQLKDWNVTAIQSAEKATDPSRFYNRRTEMWWYVSEEIRQREVFAIKDIETKRQLVTPKYDVIDSNGKIQLEPKRYTKAILGRSPDDADCYVYGIWGHQFVKEAKNRFKPRAYRPTKPTYRPMSWGRKSSHVRV